MSAVGIFICHDCRIATKRPTKDASNHLAHFDLIAPKVFELFKAEHKGHDCVLKSDAHGQLSGEDYDFETKTFRINS